MSTQALHFTEDALSDELIKVIESKTPELPSPMSQGGPGFQNPYQFAEYSRHIPKNHKQLKELLAEHFGGRLVSVQVSDKDINNGTLYVWDGTIHKHEAAWKSEDGDTNLIPAHVGDALASLYRKLREFHIVESWDAIRDSQDATKEIDKGGRKSAKKYESSADYQIDLEVERTYEFWVKKIFAMEQEFSNKTAPDVAKKFLANKFSQPAGYFDLDENPMVTFNNGYSLAHEDFENAKTVEDLMGKLRKPTPYSRNLRKTSINLTEDYEDKGLWSAFLKRTVVDGDKNYLEEDVATLQKLVGCAILGEGAAKNIVSIVGPTSSGKGSYVSMISKILGQHRLTGYASEIDGRSIQKTARFERADFRGQRFPVIQEPPTEELDGNFLKIISGGTSSTIAADVKNKEGITFSSQGVLHLVSNDYLNFDSVDKALRDRMLIFTFLNSMSTDDPDYDVHFEDKIIKYDGESILRWILQGAIDFIKAGSKIVAPDSIKRRQMDNVARKSVAARWIDYELSDPDGSYRLDPSVPKTRSEKAGAETWKRFLTWCESNDIAPNYRPRQNRWKEEVASFIGQDRFELEKPANGSQRFTHLVSRSTKNGRYDEKGNLQTNDEIKAKKNPTFGDLAHLAEIAK